MILITVNDIKYRASLSLDERNEEYVAVDGQKWILPMPKMVKGSGGRFKLVYHQAAYTAVDAVEDEGKSWTMPST